MGSLFNEMMEEISEKDIKIADLEAKLAESENNVYELQTKLNLKEYAPAFCSLAGRNCEVLGKVDQLKQQLEENEKEETKRMEDFEKRCQEYYNSDEYKRDFAIAELEKARKKACMVFWAINNEKYLNLVKEIIDQIDQQIKELKGEK